VDNICHTLVGAACGEAGLKQRTRYGSAALMLSANVPDVDVVVFLTDISAVSFRRGWTHGLPAQWLLPLAVAAVFWTIAQFRGPRGAGPPARAGWLVLLSYIGVYSHVALDLLNSYGVRLLAPFEWRWFYGDAVFIVDPWLWLVLGGGVWLARRQRRSVPAGGALVFAACYILAMVVSARAALGIVADLWRETRGTEPRALMVGPVPISPFAREVIVDAGSHYERGTFTWLPVGLTFDPERIPKNASRAETAAAREQSRDVREFLVWARFPFWIIEERPEGTQVVVADMRFAEAATAAGARFTARTMLPREQNAHPGSQLPAPNSQTPTSK
jgi:inner membrane protein